MKAKNLFPLAIIVVPLLLAFSAQPVSAQGGWNEESKLGPPSDQANAGLPLGIEEDAITQYELAPGSVTTDELVDETITSADIAADTITGDDIAAGTITSDEIADETITIEKLAPELEESLSPEASRTAVVRDCSGGCNLGAGEYDSPATAMYDSASWCPATPCLLVIKPGIYDLGTDQVVMQPYIDIQGSGRGVTIITSAVSSSSANASSAVLIGANYATVSSLTVRNTGGNSISIAIINHNASPRIDDVLAEASGGAAVNYGIFNWDADPVINNTEARATGGTTGSIGVNNNGSDATMLGVTAIAESAGANKNEGVYNSSGSDVEASGLRASASGGTVNYGVHIFGVAGLITDATLRSATGTGLMIGPGSTDFRIAHSSTEGVSDAEAGTTNCYKVVDLGSFTELSC